MTMNKILFGLYCIIALCFFQLSNAKGQPNYYQFRHLTIENGLSQNTVSAIVQDNFGFIWLGTQNGLNRYDGYQFEAFYYDESDSTSISNNQIKALFVDSKGRLWIGTEGGGLNLYLHGERKFKRYEYHPDDTSAICSNDINVIYQDLLGNIWIGTRNGLNKYIEKTDNFRQFKHTDGDSNGISNNFITGINTSSPDYLWISTHGGGLDKLNLKNETVEVLKKEDGNTINDNNLWSVYDDTLGKVWVGAERGGLNELSKSTNKWRYYGYYPIHLTSTGQNMVRNLVAGLNGDIWIGSDGGGVYQLNHGANRFFREYRQNIYHDEGLASNSINALYRDKDDELWIGMADAGVDRINLKQKPFYNLSHIPGNDISICDNRVNCIYQDSEGNYWIATEGGLNYADSTLQKFHYFFEEYNNSRALNNNVAVCIYEASNGEIWIGTYLGGINIYNKKTKKFRYLTAKGGVKNSLPSNFVRTIYEDRDGFFWIGTIRGGLCSYDPQNGRFKNYSLNDAHGLNSKIDFIMKIIGDNNGHIYIATYGGGLKIMDTRSEKVTTISQNLNHLNSLCNNEVISLVFDADSNLWVGTVNGLNRINRQTGAVQSFTEEDGLPDNFIYGLVTDKHNNLWISTNNGLSKLDAHTGFFENYYKEDGLLSNEFRYNSALSDNKGRLFFGGIKGLIYFNPDDIKQDDENLKVVFTHLVVNNNEIEVGDKLNGTTILSKPLYTTDELNLSYLENNFTISFSALQFTCNGKTKFRYKLEGESEHFINLGFNNFISFTNLNPGHHKLAIQASINDFSSPCNTTYLEISIKPPFYKSSWFIISLIISICGLLLLLYYLRINSIKRKKRILEKLVKERTKDLREVNTLLEENQAELLMQQEELISQRDLANEQAEQIQLQNKELQYHRQNLEKLIEERTNELQIAKDKAEESDALKTSFLANMSHEIRTPMNAILGFIELLDETIYTPEERKKFRTFIHSSGQSLLSLINDIIDIAKIESGQIDIFKSEFDLVAVFTEMKYIYSKKISEDLLPLDLTLDMPESLIVKTDELRIKQVLINLLDNALKFTEKGNIQFGCKQEGEIAHCYVRDTGMGIPSEFIDLIFDRFRKVDSEEGRVYRGTGLGLAISKNIIELLGGNIWVESIVDKGSTFYFTFPVS